MSKFLLTILMALCASFCFAQANEDAKLIELATTYNSFMFRNESTKSALASLKKDMPKSLATAHAFISQTITTNNKLLSAPFLTLPDEATLKQLYIVDALFANMQAEQKVDNQHLLDSLKKVNIVRNELIHSYYQTLFTAVGNKNQPFDMSKVNFKMADYKLQNETEKGIFFLECMHYCGTVIWGYFNIVNPPNTKAAFENIQKYPKFNEQPYYQYNAFSFPDFEIKITTDEPIQSYKAFYIDKYYEVLLSHAVCLVQTEEVAKRKEMEDLLLGSILREKSLYKYSKQKEILEAYFQEVKE